MYKLFDKIYMNRLNIYRIYQILCQKYLWQMYLASQDALEVMGVSHSLSVSTDQIDVTLASDELIPTEDFTDVEEDKEVEEDGEDEEDEEDEDGEEG